MPRSYPLLWLAAAVLVAATGCQNKPAKPAAASNSTTSAATMPTIGGEPVVHLTRKQTGDSPQFLGITVFPGRGMNVFQITAYVPGKGKIDVLASPSLETAAHTLTGTGADHFGDASYTFGGAFLIPYPNRIFGKVSADKKTIITEWHGQKMVLPANAGNSKGPTAMHGLILESKIQDIKVTRTPNGEILAATLHAGNFGGHWLSSTDLHFTITLTGPTIDAEITATNVGKAAEPMAIGWHPYFAIPSRKRAQARLYVPATMRALDSSPTKKPTGKLQPVKGTPYDFHVPGGKPLGSLSLDDNFSHFIRSNGGVDVRLTDPAASYGIEEIGLSPEIRTVQIYAPADKQFVAFEQQYNFVDPFGKEWHGMDTGMVDLKPGKSTTWHVRLHLFTPSK